MLKAIEKIIKGNVYDFCRDISSKYQIPYNELIDIWENSNHTVSESSRTEPVSESRTEPVSESSRTEPVSESSRTEQMCPKIMKKGKNKGKECGNKPRKNCMYCSKHKNFEGVIQEEPSRQNVPNIITSNTNTMKWMLHPVLNLWWDPKTAFIKKSENDNTIIGKCVDNKRVELSDKDKKICKERKMKYIFEIVEEEVVEEEEEVVEEEEEVVEEEEEVVEEEEEVVEEEEESTNVKSEIMRTLFGDDDIENVLSEIQY